MPTIGSFHRQYWRARANPIAAPGAPTAGGYHQWMTVPRSAVGFSMAIWGVSFDSIRPIVRRWRDAYRLWRRIDRLTAAQRSSLDLALQRLEAGSPIWPVQASRLDRLDDEQRSVVTRVLEAIEGPWWEPARAAVRTCATTPKFHQPEQWTAYSRAIKANIGQAQNVFRHLKAVSELRSLADGEAAISNPAAHLVIELAYQGMAALPSRPRQIVNHPVLH